MARSGFPVCHAVLSADCPTCQADARETVALQYYLEPRPQAASGSFGSSLASQQVRPLPPAVDRSTRILDHITVALGVFATALVLILAALQISRWLPRDPCPASAGVSYPSSTWSGLCRMQSR